MPYVDIVSNGDYASIWYTTNTASSNIGGFDPEKPTIVMFHPLFLDSTWLHPQLDDPRLSKGFNIVVFDARTTGRSLSRPNGKYDLWVHAADLAFAFHYLRIPPAHIFATELSSYAALRLAALFPELCLSVTLVNVPAQTEIQSVFVAIDELLRLWCYAEDLQSFEYACKELLAFFAGPDAHVDLQDELAAYWQLHYPPFRRSYVITNVDLMLNRVPLRAQELQAITAPVVIIQAERSETHPLPYAEELAAQLTNARGGVTVFPVKANQGYLSVISASIVNQVFYKFLTRQPHARSDFREPEMPIKERMHIALATLAEFQGNPAIAERDPLCPLSFSCHSAEVIKSQSESFKSYQVGERQAYSPLGPDGRPQRKLSERNDHWLGIGGDGFSYSDVGKFHDSERRAKNDRDKRSRQTRRDNDTPEPSVFVPSEPVSSELQQVARDRRAHANSAAVVEQRVIKGSMAKVVASSSVNIPRMLR